MAKRPVDKTPFLNAVKAELGNVNTITRAEVFAIMEKYGLKDPLWLTKNDAVRVGRGVYSLDDVDMTNVTPAAKIAKSKPIKAADIASAVPVAQVTEVANHADMAMALHASSDTISLVPDKAKGYVPFGHFPDVRMIIKSGKFYPTYITGLSGNGKTMMIEQICAQEKRELVRANITKETDEDDLIGGFRLIDGKTVWQNGPVIVAMERGAILLLDEVDLGDAILRARLPAQGQAVSAQLFWLAWVDATCSHGFNSTVTWACRDTIDLPAWVGMGTVSAMALAMAMRARGMATAWRCSLRFRLWMA